MAAINAENYDIFVKEMGADDTTYLPVGCLLDVSGFLSKGSREVSTSACVNIGSVDEKTLKKIKYADGTVKYNYNPTDTAGKQLLNSAYDDGKTKLTVRLEMDDKPVGGTHGTYVERDVLVKQINTERGDNWEETASLEFLGAYTVTAAA